MDDLQQRVQEAILHDPRTKDHEIEVLDENGIIKLKGEVSHPEISEAAESIVEEVYGIGRVINELHVEIKELDESVKETVSEG